MTDIQLNDKTKELLKQSVLAALDEYYKIDLNKYKISDKKLQLLFLALKNELKNKLAFEVAIQNM